MNLNENILRLKGLMGLIYEQQETKDNWLYDWFKNVPEDKIKNTFQMVQIKLPTTQNKVDNNIKSFEKTVPLTKEQILNILSKNVEIVQIPWKELYELKPGAIAVYFENNTKDLAAQTIKLIEPIISELQDKSKTKPLGLLDKQNFDKYNNLVSRLKKLSVFSGKVVISDRSSERAKLSGLDMKDVVRHEMVHALYDMTQEAAEKTIDSICTKKDCEDYYKKRTEIYAYLFTLRSKFNLMPTDVIQSVNVQQDKKNSTITIIVNRNNKNFSIKNSLPNDSSTIEALRCCTGNFGSSLKKLHNSLATSKKQSPQNLA